MTPSMGTRFVHALPGWPRARWLLALVALLGPILGFSARSQAYTPDSPEVREMLTRAMTYLETASKGGEGGMLGGECLMGLAAYKYNKRFGQQSNTLPALTQQGLAVAIQSAGRLKSENNYSVGIALILLCEVHPQQHIPAITAYMEELLKRQKPNGGWGYSEQPAGDLSQLQYGVLGLWSAKNAGLQVPEKSIVDVVNYVIRVQDPSGAWGYQGKDPGGYTRVPQTKIRPSLCAAGAGSLYVGADFLGMSKTGKPRTISARKLPPALIPVVEDDKSGRGRLRGSIDPGKLKQAMNDGQQWFRKRNSLRANMYQYYFLYGLERYESFKEKVNGTYEEEPRWYNDGVRLLRELQGDKGSWGIATNMAVNPTGTTPPIATSFSMLFLLRSTRETIEQVIERDGLLHGGRGLPGDLTEIRLRNNKIVAPAITGEVEDLITMLEDEEGEKIENMLENPDALSLSGMTGSGREFTARLARILRTGKSYKARIVAARTLGRQGDLDNVPVLIYGLTDPDPRVVIEARDGLRLISRKFDGFGLSDKPTPSQRRTAVKAWKDWYKSIRPDAVFIE